MMITVIGRGHSGTRSMSHTLIQSGVYMGEEINVSGDLLDNLNDIYDACRVFAKYVKYEGDLKWDFSKVLSMPIDPEFTRLVESYLSNVLKSDAPYKGWKIPETTLIYPWIVRMFPDIRYIHWVRDPRDCILSGHLTDDLHKFGIDYDDTDDIRLRRAISWKYQRDIMNATPEPEHVCRVRFEDMVFNQDETLKRLEKFLGIPLAKIEMRSDSVGRYKTAEGVSYFDFFRDEMEKCGYEF